MEFPNQFILSSPLKFGSCGRSDLPWIFTSAALPHEVVGGLSQGGSLKVAVCVVQEGFAQLCLLLLQLAGRRVQLLLRFLNDTCESGDHRNPATVT